LETYNGKSVYYADLHNHCNMSYAHGDLEDALENARQRLDVCSVTGHADWPDMPRRDGKIDHIIDFHEKGFEKLKKGWKHDLETMKRFNREERFLVFPGFEIHSMEAGDYTIVSKGFDVELVYPESIAALQEMLRADAELRARLLTFPHHIGYLSGRRGINWEHFAPDVSPLVEMYSMHGCAEADENDKPFLHTMGPVSAHGTIQYGLGAAGARFGVLGNTDHHSAHPGSYGHGCSGIWAERLERESIWEALQNRRTYALSADKMGLKFAVNKSLMGSTAPLRDSQELVFDIAAGGVLDHVDIIKNGRLYHRFSQPDMTPPAAWAAREMKTALYLEVGWGERGKPFQWDVQFGISGGTIVDVDARFRGDEVVSPLDATGEQTRYFRSSWEYVDDGTVSFTTETRGNPTNSTPATQGVALEVSARRGAEVFCRVNGTEHRVLLEDLLEGSYVAYTGGFDSPAFKLHRAPYPQEYRWSGSVSDTAREPAYYYLRARQKNGAWAWSSPIWVE